jgi:hypothetical protein
MEPTPRHREAEAAFRSLLEDGGLPQPDAVEVSPYRLLFLWHEPKLAVSLELDDPDDPGAGSANGTLARSEPG